MKTIFGYTLIRGTNLHGPNWGSSLNLAVFHISDNKLRSISLSISAENLVLNFSFIVFILFRNDDIEAVFIEGNFNTMLKV